MSDSKDGKKEEKAPSIITAVYKVNLHCGQCARKIKKPINRVEGVHSVDVDTEKGEIKVKGGIDPIKIHKLIEKLSKKKVELISPKIKAADKQKDAAPAQKKKEPQEEILYTTSMKVHLHCDQCEKDLRKKLLKHKGIFSVKTDMKAQRLTVQGSIKPDKLLSYMKKNVHKHAEIISSKEEKKEEKKEDKKEDKKEEKKEDKKGKQDDGEKSNVKTQIIEYNQEVRLVEVKSKEGNAPYFIHYVYAPQLFSDENPNACCIV